MYDSTSIRTKLNTKFMMVYQKFSLKNYENEESVEKIDNKGLIVSFIFKDINDEVGYQKLVLNYCH